MDQPFFLIENEFHAFSVQHGVPVLGILLIGLIAIIIGIRTTSRARKKHILLFLSIFPALSVIASMLIQLSIGQFTLANDLPLHICRLLALLAPFVIWKENKFWLGVFYFWIIVGTLNAVITPDLEWGIPHWTYYYYFILHVFLVLLPLYYTIVLKFRVRARDLWNAYWTANVFLIISLPINFLLESNYMFTRHKPLVPTLIDSMGPWPWYLVSLQFLALLLFIIVYLPFYFLNKKYTKES